MKHDVNIIPVLINNNDDKSTSINSTNKYIKYLENDKTSFEFGFSLCINGIASKDYNVYVFLTAYKKSDSNKQVYMPLGSIRLEEDKMYSKIYTSLITTTQPPDTEDSFSVTVYTMLPEEDELTDSISTKFERISNEKGKFVKVFKNGSIISSASFDIVESIED